MIQKPKSCNYLDFFGMNKAPRFVSYPDTSGNQGFRRVRDFSNIHAPFGGNCAVTDDRKALLQ
jgi:hypothetical protein